MSTAHIWISAGLLLIIAWVLATMAGDIIRGVSRGGRTIVTLGTAGWFHGASSMVYGQADACITHAWPVGTQLRVYNSAGVFVDVVVVPEPLPFVASERVLVHLARPAFQQLAPLGIDHLHVEVELLDIAIGRSSSRRTEKQEVRP